MKIRTIDELAERLDEELAWRKRELTFLYFHADNESDRHQREAILRGALALLYAHFEGFVKAGIFLYLSHVATSRVAVQDLSSRLAPFFARIASDETVRSGARAGLYEFAQLIRGEAEGDRRFQIRRESVVTGGNLSSKRLANLLFDSGLNMNSTASDNDLIDELLLARRNTIAHGEYDTVSLDEFHDLRARIVAIMDRLSTCILNAAVSKAYLRCNG